MDTRTPIEDLEEVTRPLLRALSDATGLDSTYLTRVQLNEGVQEIVFSRNDGNLVIAEGLEIDWEDTLCKRALESGLMCTSDVPEVWADAVGAQDLGIITYVSTPVYLQDGTLFGTLCGASSRPIDLDERDRALLHLFGEVVSDQLERERAAREAEERAQQAEQQLEQRAAFLAQAEHALKTPITVIKGFADLLEMSWERLDDVEKRQDVEQIGRAATQLTERIHQLLDEARSEVLARDMSPEPIDLLAFAQEICDDLSALSDRHPVEVTGEPRTALVDPRALRLILEHLVENAVKYSPDGGTVEVQIDGSSEGPVIRVRDSGIGIPQGVDLFAAFTRGPTDTEGAGLGLHIVSNLLRALGGHISAERNGDRGSTFVVRFGAATGTGREPTLDHSSPK